MQLLFQNCGASCRVFQRRFKMAVRANFCALQRWTFPTRGLTSFLNVLAFSNRITTNFFSNLWCKFLCFSTAFQNGSACKFLCPATLHFSDKSVHKFLDVLAFSNRITANFFSNLWCKLPCFFNCDSKEKCVQIFVPCKVALFLQDGSQVFWTCYFLQPYYDKRCCEICYLLPKIWNFTKKIAKKYLKPLTVFGDWYIM